MSIRDEMKARVREGRLVEYRPWASNSILRPAFLEADIGRQVLGPWQDNEDAARMPYVRADLETFVQGKPITAAFGRRARVNFRRLERDRRGRPKVWEMRTLAPPPGYRLFGFFAETDVFVGVELQPRDAVDFKFEINRAERAWGKPFRL